MSAPLLPTPEQFRSDFLRQLIFPAVEAKRAAILLLGRDSDEFVTATYAEPGEATASEFPIDDTITEKALKAGMPVVHNDGNSVICAPLIADDAACRASAGATASRRCRLRRRWRRAPSRQRRPIR